MPKLRNADTPLAQFTQWLGRKCRNHHPLSELALQSTERAALPSRYKNTKAAQVTIAQTPELNQVIYELGGTAFMIEVREIDPDELQTVPRVAVGH